MRADACEGFPRVRFRGRVGVRVDPVAIEACIVQRDARELARSMLEEMGYAVSEADSGEAAIDQLDREGGISLLFTDCMMPGRLDGLGLATELRRQRPDLPVLFTSGIWAGVDRIGSDTSNLAFLPKPYTAEQLGAAVRRLLERSPVL